MSGPLGVLFQLNTIQRLTETVNHALNIRKGKQVPIKHYPTINWNLKVDLYPWLLSVPIKHYPTINWNPSHWLEQVRTED